MLQDADNEGFILVSAKQGLMAVSARAAPSGQASIVALNRTAIAAERTNGAGMVIEWDKDRMVLPFLYSEIEERPVWTYQIKMRSFREARISTDRGIDIDLNQLSRKIVTNVKRHS